MEKVLVLAIPLLLLVMLLRLMLLPMKLAWKLLCNSAGGFLCLWLLNLLAWFTGIYFEINFITALIAGLLGLPGIFLLALVQIFL